MDPQLLKRLKAVNYFNALEKDREWGWEGLSECMSYQKRLLFENYAPGCWFVHQISLRAS